MAAMQRLKRLSLTDFRNYARLVWTDPERLVVLSGENGSGKTNLLEAVSLLVPGRGLRGARGGHLLRQQAEPGAQWGVAAVFEQDGQDWRLGTAGDPQRAGRRVFSLDGAAPRNRDEVAERLAAVWLTPQMDRLFSEGASARRRFLDRLVLALEPGHAREVAAHDAALAQRNRLLGGSAVPDPGWLDALEASIARHAVAVTAARADLVRRLNAVASDAAGLLPGMDAFPRPRLALVCAIGERLRSGSALAVEDALRAGLASSRAADRAQGTASIGAHRSDMALVEAATGTDAALASTGQQKTLLIGVVLAHARAITALRGLPPLLLLDEPMVHLDEHRRGALLATLAALPGPVLVSGTDAAVFDALRGRAQFIRVASGELTS